MDSAKALNADEGWWSFPWIMSNINKKQAILLLCDIYECFLYKNCRIMLNSNEYYYLALLPMFDVTFVIYVCMCGQMARWIFFGWNDKKL